MNQIGIAWAALLIVLNGCSITPSAGTHPALCDARCVIPCVGEHGDTGIRWQAKPDDRAAFDALGEAVIPALSEKLRRCELHRRACEQCLRRLDERGVIAL